LNPRSEGFNGVEELLIARATNGPPQKSQQISRLRGSFHDPLRLEMTVVDLNE
jgi:hypothetical protein